MIRPVSILVLLGAAGATTSCSLPQTHDPLAVVERYPHRFQGVCSSWLRSHRTGYKYCASPVLKVAQEKPFVATVAAPAPAPVADRPTDLDSLRAHGEGVYGRVCIACHGPEAKGTPPLFPPLAGSGEFYGEPQNMARIIVHGLSGEIVVQGQTYNGMMPPQGAALDDYDIAAVATYVRTSFGNDDGIVLPSDVAAVR